jgi:hypothetical protein
VVKREKEEKKEEDHSIDEEEEEEKDLIKKITTNGETLKRKMVLNLKTKNHLKRRVSF